MSRFRAVASGVGIGVPLASMVACLGLRPPPGASPPDLPGALIAHRAGMDEAPENSLRAIRHAAAAGADAVELDVRAGPEGPVCAHDADQVPGAPRLADALELTSSLGLAVELDVKTGPLGSPRLIRQVVDVVAGRPGVWISAFHPAALWWVRRADPGLPVGWPMSAVPWVAPGRWLGACVLEPADRWATPERLAAWQAQGWMVEVWTVADPERVRALRGQGVAVVVDAVGPHVDVRGRPEPATPGSAEAP